jgi:hypothetical protein
MVSRLHVPPVADAPVVTAQTPDYPELENRLATEQLISGLAVHRLVNLPAAIQHVRLEP